MKQSTLNDYKQRMLKVLMHIQRNLDEDLSLDELAELANFSPYHFHRIFKGMIGESLKEHIRRIRLERAAGRLKQTDMPVIQIALEAGYETHEAFSRAFKVMSGYSPSNYRALNNPTVNTNPPSGVRYHFDCFLKTFTFSVEGGMTMKVEIKTLKPMKVAFMRHVGPYDECGRVWEQLLTVMGSQGYMGPDTKIIGLCYDDPDVTPADKIRYDACITVDNDFKPQNDIGVQTIEGGEYAMTTHFGPYNRLNETYSKFLGQWLPQSGRELKSLPCLEIYMNDPEGTDPEDLITDIYAPLVS